jgi:hypothetical protein
MADKRGSSGSKAVNALVGAAAAFVARKVLSYVWKTITGKQPPEHPEDPQVALGEAVIWGMLVGAGVSTARMLATRAASGRRKTESDPDGPPV